VEKRKRKEEKEINIREKEKSGEVPGETEKN